MVPTAKILEGHCLDRLRELPDNSVHCCVTSPPYWGLRDYKIPPVRWPEIAFSPMAGLPTMVIPAEDAVHGLEPDLWHYIAHEVAIFREVRRVLREDGTLWLNLGDSYATGSGGNGTTSEKQISNRGTQIAPRGPCPGLKPKDLIGVPWRVALALQADGWWLRSDIIWHKPNPMPESVTDRPTKAHEYIFLLTKDERYFYDAEAVKEPQSLGTHERFGKNPAPSTKRKIEEPGRGIKNNHSFNEAMRNMILGGRNRRTVWTVPSFPFKGAHFATFPPDLIRPCILAGTSARGCCPQCGAPWERVVGDTPEYAAFKESERARKGGGMRSSVLETSGLTRGSANKSIVADRKTLSWQPTCECHGKLVMETVIVSPTDTTSWNGSRFDDGKNAEIKPNQGKLAEKERTQKRLVYHSDLPLDQHPIQPCTVLDPFSGSGTTAQVALEEGRNAIGIELNPEYIHLGNHRTNVTPALAIA